MNEDQDRNSNPSETIDLKSRDQDVTKSVGDILNTLTHAVSLIKIFSLEHDSSQKFILELESKLFKFLNIHPRLEIGVNEFSFTFENEVVYNEENPLKSLPFLFFKDGIYRLIFLKGLDHGELVEFLDTIKKISLLPAEEGDIVSVLWEKDFLNIRYIALDNFLESKIGKGRQAITPEFRLESLREGQIRLDEEDRTALSKSPETNAQSSHEEKRSESLFLKGSEAILDTQEKLSIDSFLQAERGINEEGELIELIFELLHLEERLESFKSSLDVTLRLNNNLINSGHWAKSVLLMNYIKDLYEGIEESSDRKKQILHEFIKKMYDSVPLEEVKNIFLREKLENVDDLFNFLIHLGPRGIHLIGDLLKEILDLNFRKRAFTYLKTFGEHDLDALLNLAQEGSQDLVSEIIKILVSIGTMEALSKLDLFISDSRIAVRMEVIHALESVREEETNLILFRFLQDEDDEVRILAINKLKYMGNEDILKAIIILASQKNLIKKDKEEKRAVINFLGRSRKPEACTVLEGILKKFSFFPSARLMKTQLLVVSALETMETQEAAYVLKKGSSAGNKKIRLASKLALRRMNFSQSNDSRSHD